MTNKQFLIVQIKRMLERDDLADHQRVRLLSLLAKHVPQTRRRRRKAAKPAGHKIAPFQRPVVAPTVNQTLDHLT